MSPRRPDAAVGVERSCITRFLVVNVVALRKALDDHNETCPVPARAFLLHPVDRGLLPWDALWGVPIHADDRVPVKRFRLDCGASAWRIEEALDLFGDPRDG